MLSASPAVVHEMASGMKISGSMASTKLPKPAREEDGGRSLEPVIVVGPSWLFPVRATLTCIRASS